MDHRDHIEGPSVERRKLIEKRMEMIAILTNQMNEGGNQKPESQSEKKRKRINDSNNVMTLKWLGQFVTLLQRMLT